MRKRKAAPELTEDHRRKIFEALVAAQDKGDSVAKSRITVGEQFGLPEQQLAKIEREGLDKEWPPLS